MLRFAAAYGFAIERTLLATAARLSQGRLLAPPSNLAQTGHRKPPEDTLAELDPHRAPPMVTADPREPEPRFAGHLDPELLSANSKWLTSRVELCLDSHAGAIATCAPPAWPRQHARWR